MKCVHSLQKIFSSFLSDSLQSPQGLLVTWADTLRTSSSNDIDIKHLNGMHATVKTHFNCIDPRKLDDIQTGKDFVISASGVSNLTFLDCESVITVSSLLMNEGWEIIGICDKSGLRDNEWLRQLTVGKFINLSELREVAEKLVTSKSLSDQWRAAQKLMHKHKEQEDQICHKKVYLVSSSDAAAVKLVASVFYSFFPYFVVLALPVSQSTLEKLPASDQYVNLPDYSAITTRFCGKGDSIIYRGKVSAIINLYKRYETCIEIYRSLVRQSYRPQYIYIWVNGVVGTDQISDLRKAMPLARFVVSDENLGVWARFAFGLNVVTEYTVIFDDDTIPGSAWIENCMNCMIDREALYGTVGLIYNRPLSYMNHVRVGWPAPNEDSRYVDIVGHSWFFKTDWLRRYWHEVDDIDGIPFCGEDMHFSYALQTIGIPTIVPPHPLNKKEMWGSLKGLEAGTGKEAISISGKGSMMDIPLKHLVARGFELIRFTH